jgi:hypothetical protein
MLAWKGRCRRALSKEGVPMRRYSFSFRELTDSEQ